MQRWHKTSVIETKGRPWIHQLGLFMLVDELNAGNMVNFKAP